MLLQVPAVVTKEDAPGDADAVVNYLVQIFLNGQSVPRDSSFLGYGRIPETILQTKVDFSDPSRSCTYAAGDTTFLVGGSLTVTVSLEGQLQQATVQDLITNSYLPDGLDIEIVCVLDLSKKNKQATQVPPAPAQPSPHINTTAQPQPSPSNTSLTTAPAQPQQH